MYLAMTAGRAIIGSFLIALLFVPYVVYRRPPVDSSPPSGKSPFVSQLRDAPGREGWQPIRTASSASLARRDRLYSAVRSKTPARGIRRTSRARKELRRARRVGRVRRDAPARSRRSADLPKTPRLKVAERLYGYARYSQALSYFKASLREEAYLLDAGQRAAVRGRIRDCEKELGR